MAGEQVVFHDGRYNGRTLRDGCPNWSRQSARLSIRSRSSSLDRSQRDASIETVTLISWSSCLKWRTSTTLWSLFLKRQLIFQFHSM